MPSVELGTVHLPAPAPDNKQGKLPLVDPFVKARTVIIEQEGLSTEERDEIAKSFQEKYGEAKVTEFLPILAKRKAKEAAKDKVNSQKSKGISETTKEAPAILNGPRIETPGATRRGGVLFERIRHHRPKNRS